MNWSVKDIMIQSSGEQGMTKILALRIIWQKFLLLFCHTQAHPLHNAMLARQAMPDGGQNFTLCEALIAFERRLGT
jgi:hypothetical protein